MLRVTQRRFISSASATLRTATAGKPPLASGVRRRLPAWQRSRSVLIETKQVAACRPMPQRWLSSSVASTFQSATNADYIAEMYAKWRQDANSVHKSWDVYFRSGTYQPPPTFVADYSGSTGAGSPGPAVPGIPSIASANELGGDIAKLMQLVRAYQVRGHLASNIDPLGLMKPRIEAAELSAEKFGLTEKDLDKVVDLSVLEDNLRGFIEKGRGKVRIRDIVTRAKEVYCSTIGYEYMHIPSVEECNWIRSKIETMQAQPVSKDKKLQILDRLAWADMFERFLATKWNTAKRFGLEGGESAIPGIKAMVDVSSELGVEAMIIGMPHRGRLNVLSTVMRKPMEALFNAFSGGGHADAPEGSGDVKYHLGLSVTRNVGPNNKPMHLSLMANPSHLEAVDPVVLGKARAKQLHRNDPDRSKVVPLLMHGDAAFAGQGVVYESMGMTHLENYGVGGTLHVVVNNQIGFTTDPEKGRSSAYSTDLAKAFNAPIFHVNGDDPEAVVKVCELAAQFRAKFKKDVVVDVVCYRKHGHNEIDEPRFTQPIMYGKIGKMPSTLQVYKDRLLKEGTVTEAEVQAIITRIQGFLNEKFEASKTYKPKDADWMSARWQGFKGRRELSKAKVTGVELDRLKKIGEKLVTLPQGFTVHPRLKGILDKKKRSLETGQGLDWATCEALAFGTLLEEGNHVRLSGQDVERGTFSHRHAVLHDQSAPTRKTHVPLQHLGSKAPFTVCNSHLSEYGVLGFELGYSMEDPASLVLWEAQFGDFFNGAQIIVDQFLSSMEAKWLRQSGLVMLLPHGYEGQGPEHSSARLERFLQGSDDKPDEIPDKEGTEESKQIQNSNWQVVNCSVPANYFHVLRRQLYREFRKPLIIMTPKSLLRDETSSSALADMGAGTMFTRVYGEVEPAKLVEPAKIKKVIFCSGKVYFDLLKYRRNQGIKDVAIARIEQISPFPFSSVAAEVKKYANAEVVWCQEEPMNMGAWTYVTPRMETALKGVRGKDFRPRYIGRPPSASTAAGNIIAHEAEQTKFVKEALS